jgi:adenylosuccinate lyase
MASAGAVQGSALLDALRSDKEVVQYLSPDELRELMNTNYYLKYIDTSFKRVGLSG